MGKLKAFGPGYSDAREGISMTKRCAVNANISLTFIALAYFKDQSREVSGLSEGKKMHVLLPRPATPSR